MEIREARIQRLVNVLGLIADKADDSLDGTKAVLRLVEIHKVARRAQETTEHKLNDLLNELGWPSHE